VDGGKPNRQFEAPPGGWPGCSQASESSSVLPFWRAPFPHAAAKDNVQVAASANGFVFVLHNSAQVFVFNGISGSFVTSFCVSQHNEDNHATCICAAPNADRVYVGLSSGAVQLWSL